MEWVPVAPDSAAGPDQARVRRPKAWHRRFGKRLGRRAAPWDCLGTAGGSHPIPLGLAAPELKMNMSFAAGSDGARSVFVSVYVLLLYVCVCVVCVCPTSRCFLVMNLLYYRKAPSRHAFPLLLLLSFGLTRFVSDQCSALFVTPVRLASIVCVVGGGGCT